VTVLCRRLWEIIFLINQNEIENMLRFIACHEYGNEIQRLESLGAQGRLGLRGSQRIES